MSNKYIVQYVYDVYTEADTPEEARNDADEDLWQREFKLEDLRYFRTLEDKRV
jgi:hypothetical protein